MRLRNKSTLKGKSLIYWRIIQIITALIGLGIFFSLIFFPEIGIHAFWDIFIPIAPLLFIVAIGVWRNICPIAFIALIPRRLGVAKNKSLSEKQQGRLQFISVCLLLLIIPLRHTIFDTNAIATVLIISLLAIGAIYFSFQYNWKSAWCSGLCPVHPVEKMYGNESPFILANAHCKNCEKCISPCPDSIPSVHNIYKSKKIVSRKIAGDLMVGGFPGFIWGWFHVQDYYNDTGWSHLMVTYAYPVLTMLVTLFTFYVAKKFIKKTHQMNLIKIFATLGVCTYYWYRLPELFGFGLFRGDGMLIDLKEIVPLWTPYILQFTTTIFFIWWMFFKKKRIQSWSLRPPYLVQNTYK